MVPPQQNANDPLQIIVLGYLVRGPLGGLAWHYLQYVLGLSRLGHHVLFVEDSDDYEACYDPSRDAMVADPSYGLAFVGHAFHRLGLPEQWAYYDAHTSAWMGPAAGHISRSIVEADLLVNVSGVTQIRHGLENIARRALIDTDPAFTQIRHLTDPEAAKAARSHTCFFTFGENFGRPQCSIPDDGLPWQPTRQPVVLDAWTVTAPPVDGPLTTVMQWDSYPAQEYDGRTFGMKSASFAPYLDLPQSLDDRFELAVGSPSAPRQWLREHGWHVINPLQPTRDPWTYQKFLADSAAEFGVAKQGYVSTRSGWFSERTAAYLASGRPAVVQDTGFSDFIPNGSGLIGYTDFHSACAGIRSVREDPMTHSRAARELAESHFDSTQVLEHLIDRCFA